MRQHEPEPTRGAERPYGTRRTSAARAAIAATAAGMTSAFTADELHARVVESQPGVGLATVYRAVSAMTDAGYLDRVGERDGAALYAVCGHADHHHHTVCERCGVVIPVACTFAPSSLPAGFVITRHEVAIYGLCAACAASNDESEGA